jgi:sec-independent protein translocase protein TatA
MNVMLAFLNGPEIIVIAAVVFLMFGAKKLPELARGLGQGIKEFKKGAAETPEDTKKP